MNLLEKRIKEKYPNEDIEVIQYTKMADPATVKCKKCGNKYTLARADNFLRKNKKCICKSCINNGSGGRLTLENFQEKINKKYPEENIKVLSYSLRKNPCTVQCLTCGKIITLENADSFLLPDKKYICHRCHKNKQEIINKTISTFYGWINKQQNFDFCFPIPKDLHSKTLVLSKCKKCGHINKKTMYDYMKGRQCSKCANNVKKTKEEYQAEIGDEYTVLTYNGMEHRSKFKHNLCGFIYTAPTRYYLCPRCKGSKGERAIRYFLLKNNITFEEQKRIYLEGHIFIMDFYLPSKNLYIEYNGEQHYRPVDFFGGEEGFKKQQEKDKIKRKCLTDNLLEISYLDYENIDKILTQKFIDYPSQGVGNQTS